MAHAQLGTLGGVEAGEHDLAFIRDAVAVRVFQIQNIGGRSDKEAAAPEGEAVDVAEVGGEFTATFEASVTVEILQQRDAARSGVAAALDRVGVAAPLGDKEPAGAIEDEGNGIDHEGFGRDEFDAETCLELKQLERLFRRARGMPLGGRGLRQVGWEERNEEAGELGKEPPTRGVGLRAHGPWLLNRHERGRNLGDSARPTMKFLPRLFATTAVVLRSGLRSPTASGSIECRVRHAVTGPSSATPASSY